MREYVDKKVAKFTAVIEFMSRTLDREEAGYLLADVKGVDVDQAMLVEPSNPDQILLHNEAIDT